MELKEYREKAFRTMPDLGSSRENVIHMLLGLSTEIGELQDIFKKKIAYDKDVDWTNVYEEIGDLMWYISNLSVLANDVPLEDILQNNIDKLKARYPEKFTTEKANNRNLDKERKVLEEIVRKT